MVAGGGGGYWNQYHSVFASCAEFLTCVSALHWQSAQSCRTAAARKRLDQTPFIRTNDNIPSVADTTVFDRAPLQHKKLISFLRIIVYLSFA